MVTSVYMMTPVLHFSSVTVLLVLAATVTMCVPTHFTDPEQHFRNSIDLDAEQTEARYDQEMLSDIIKDNDRGELQKAESCLVDDYKYDHGQKIQRLDPCEICLCIDGEIFCWWKQCDSQAKAAQGPDQSDHSLQQALNNDQSASEPFSESSIITSTSNAASVPTAKSKTTFEGTATEDSNSGNGATKLTLSDSLSDGGTTVISSTLPISTPSSRGQDTDHGSSETVTHHGTVHTQDTIEGIPKNILSFPQTPPIMMYRPVSTGPIGSSSPREGKYGDGGRKAKLGTMVGTRKMKSGAMGSHKKSKDHKKKPEKGSPDGRYSFDFERKPTVSIASDALPKAVADADSSREGDRFRDRGTEDFDNHSGQTVPEEQERSMSEQQQFGGYGYGMIHEPEPEHRQATPPMRGRDRDVPQHYIITSSGHVEMFDDSGTLGVSELGADSQNARATDTDEFAKPQYRDVLSFDGRVSSRVVQDQHSNGSTGEDSDATESDEDDDVEETDEQPKSENGGPVAPAIMLTTNVTQGKYSLGGGGEGPGSSTQLPASQASIIDILNSTTLVDGDYVDGTNHSELIYPEVPVISSSSGSSTTTTRSPTKMDQSNQHCVVMGVTYPVGAVLKQETGNCLQCVCVAGPENDPAPRVTCTPLNCPPLILPDILDGAGF